MKDDFSNLEPEMAANDPFDLKTTIEKFFNHWPLILLCIMLGLVGAFLINRYTTPVYTVATSALIKSPKEISNPVSELLYGQEIFGRNSTNLENEAFLFKSQQLIEKTLKELKFDVSYFQDGQIRDPEVFPNSPIVVKIDTSSSYTPYTKLIRCNIVDDNTYTLEFEKESFTKRIAGLFAEADTMRTVFDDQVFQFGKQYELKGFRFSIDLNGMVNYQAYGNLILFSIYKYDRLASSYGNNLEVQPLTPESSILTIGLEATHPKKGTKFLNRLVENYIADELSRKNFTASKTIDFISEQILLMSDSLSQAENRMEAFKKSNTKLAMSNEGSEYMQLSQQFDSEKNRIQLNNQYLNELTSNLSQNKIEDIYVPSSIGIEDATLNSSVQELVELQLQLKTIGSSKNPIIRSHQQRIGALKESIGDNIRSLKSSNQMALSSINRRIGGMQATLQSLPTAEKQFINIQRNFSLSENLFLFLMEKKAEAEIAKASNTVDYRMIDEARPGLGPIKPKRFLNYIFALLLGFLVPAMVIFVIDAFNDKITSKDDLFAITAIPYLGMVPKSQKNVILINDPNARSELVESFRTMRSNLRYMLGKESDEGKIFLLTSSVSAEGKSFCSNNLSYIFSNFGKKVILVSADMRKENNYDDFLVEDNIGLSDYLANIATEEEIIKKTAIPNLSIITSGGIPPNPSELLIGGKIELLLNRLKKEFDYIIIDTPPIGILADGMELMHKCDISIFVARQNYTLKKHISEANQIYKRHRMNNMAIILNDVSFKKQRSYYDYYYNNSRKSGFLKKAKKKKKVTVS